MVNDYESGKAVPNQQVVAKLERALGKEWFGKGRKLTAAIGYSQGVGFYITLR